MCEAADWSEASRRVAIKWMKRSAGDGKLCSEAVAGARSRCCKCMRPLCLCSDCLASGPYALMKLLRAMHKRGIVAVGGAVWRLLSARQDQRRKKSLRAAEQERAKVARARRRWTQRKACLIQPTVFSTRPRPRQHGTVRGRCPRGQRSIDYVPHGHWKTITFVAGLCSGAMVAPLALMDQ